MEPFGSQTWTLQHLSTVLTQSNFIFGAMPSDTDMTGLILLEENDLRFPRFTNDVSF